MPAFGLAARRHLRDAQHLLVDGRFPNAEHLAGFAAECAIKALLIGFYGLPSPTKGAPKLGKQAFSHLPGLWADAAIFVNGRTALAGTRASVLLASTNPFTAWSVDGRYEDGNAVTHSTANRFWGEARRLVALLEQAELNGALT